MLNYLYWDPSPEMFSFSIPLLGRPILWYGFFFATGFLLGYFVFVYLLKRASFFPADKAQWLAEKMIVPIALGAILGARLGDIIFYQGGIFHQESVFSIFKLWEGGLASHGGAVGMLIALLLFRLRIRRPFPEMTFLRLLDLLVVSTSLGASFIRIGNFFNQEILGKPSSMPWAVIFVHPTDGSSAVPRHPVQLYESFYYMAVFVVLFILYKKYRGFQKAGKVSGIFLLLIFGFRFFIEFFKEEQSALLSSDAFWTMGQFLSLPFIILGVALLLYKQKIRKL